MKKKSFTYNTLFMTCANVVTRLAGFLYRIFISRFIGAEGLGLFALVTPVYSVCCAIVASGIPVAAMKKISEADTSSKRKALTLSSLKIVFTVSVILFFGLFFLSEPLSRLLGDSRTRLSLWILSFAVLITGFENVYKSSFYSNGFVKIPAFTEIAEQIFRTVCVILMLIFISKDNITLSSAVLTAGVFLGEALSLVILSVSYRKITSKTVCEHVTVLDSGILKTAVPVTAAKTAESFLGSLSNILLPFALKLYGLSVSEATEILGVISGMIMPLLYMPCVFTNAVAVNLVPYISENLARGSRGAVIRKCEKALLVTSLFTFPCMFAMIFFKDSIAKILFSDSRVALFLPPMAVGGAAAIFRHILNSVMNACGKEKISSLYCFLGNISELLLILLFVPKFGAYGYIFAYTASNILMLIPSFVTVSSSLNLSTHSIVSSFMQLIPSGAAFYSGGILYFAVLPFFGTLVSAIISGTAAVIIYFIYIYFIGFKKKIIFFSKIT